MDYLQYAGGYYLYKGVKALGFKPYYKWITFNTLLTLNRRCIMKVLNLIINGLPSIPTNSLLSIRNQLLRFKPYYKWITFNTYFVNHNNSPFLL